MLLKPINPVAQPGDLRDITPEEKVRYSVLRDHYRDLSLVNPFNKRAVARFKWVVQVLKTGKIGSGAGSNATI